MSRQKKNGENILKKIALFNIDVPRDHPSYMREYMKTKRKLEKNDDPIIRKLENEAEKLYKELSKALKL